MREKLLIALKIGIVLGFVGFWLAGGNFKENRAAAVNCANVDMDLNNTRVGTLVTVPGTGLGTLTKTKLGLRVTLGRYQNYFVSSDGRVVTPSGMVTATRQDCSRV